MHLHVGFFLLKGFLGKLCRSHNARFKRVRVFGEVPVVISLAVALPAAVPVELDTGDEEYGNVALELLDAFAGLHDSVVSFD